MQVKDRKQIAKLMVIQNITRRALATSAGWRSHSYVNRILDGTVTTVTPDRAARIARCLGVGVDDLFVTRLSTDAGRSSQRKAS